jgi:hypothetical protein
MMGVEPAMIGVATSICSVNYGFHDLRMFDVLQKSGLFTPHAM